MDDYIYWIVGIVLFLFIIWILTLPKKQIPPQPKPINEVSEKVNETNNKYWEVCGKKFLSKESALEFARIGVCVK